VGSEYRSCSRIALGDSVGTAGTFVASVAFGPVAVQSSGGDDRQLDEPAAAAAGDDELGDVGDAAGQAIHCRRTGRLDCYPTAPPGRCNCSCSGPRSSARNKSRDTEIEGSS